ncbi:MAG: hypothetical protein LBI45_03240 [Bacteroidales bacterium]|nr:hypothetical protein [Bacteroidales bacterium]
MKDNNYIFAIIINLDAEKVAGYSPKKCAAADCFALNFVPLTQVAGYSPKKDAADPEKRKKYLFLYVFGRVYAEMARFFNCFLAIF